jgi:hypothetical protein
VNELSMNIRLDETLLRAETLFLQFQRMVSAIDRKRLEDTKETSGVRRRKGKDPESNEEEEEASSSSSTSNTITARLPIVSDLLRELLNK